MTNEEMLADLKQFITATVSQQMAHVATKEDLEVGLNGLRDSLRAKMREGFETVDEKLDEIQNAVGERLDNHERRIGRLDRRAA